MLVAIVGLAGCDGLTTELERHPSEVPISEIVDLRRGQSGALPANGEVVDSIWAWIPKEARSHTVTFKATKGGFASAAGAGEVSLRAEPSTQDTTRLRAVVHYVSDTIPGAVVVSAALEGVANRLHIQLVR